MSNGQPMITTEDLDRIAETVASKVAQSLSSRIPPRYLTLKEAAQYCGKGTAEAMRSMARRGQIRVIKLGGRLYMDRVDIDAAMEAAKVPIPSE